MVHQIRSVSKAINSEPDEYSLSDLILSLANEPLGKNRSVEHENRVSDDLARAVARPSRGKWVPWSTRPNVRAALTTEPQVSGGYLVQSNVSPDIVEFLRAKN